MNRILHALGRRRGTHCDNCGHPITALQTAVETDRGRLVHLFGCPNGAAR